MAEEVEYVTEEWSDEEDVMDAEEVAATGEEVVVAMDEAVVVEEQVQGTVAIESHKELTCKTRMLSLHYRVVFNSNQEFAPRIIFKIYVSLECHVYVLDAYDVATFSERDGFTSMGNTIARNE
jgi:hypothetical protein